MLPAATALPLQLAQASDRIRIERRLEFSNLPEGWAALGGIVAVVVLCWGVVWMYRREGRRGASAPLRAFMATLRCLVIASCAVVALQPVMATYLTRWIDSYTLVLIDDSASMDLHDAPGSAAAGPSRRLDVVDKVLSADQQRFLRELTDANRVKVYTFSDAPKQAYTLRAAGEAGERAGGMVAASGDHAEPTSQMLDAGAARMNFTAAGPSTDISRAIHRTVEALGGAPLAGVVVFSDGAFNAGDPVDTVARYARDHNVPVHVVGIGDPSPPRNIRVTEVLAPDSAFKNDPYAITVHLAAQGLTGQSRTVELYERAPSQGGTASPGGMVAAAGDHAGTPVATKPVTITADGAVPAITFERRQQAVGRWTYAVKVAAEPGDSPSVDSRNQVGVNVIENKLRVLLVSGSPSWDYRYLARLLERDPTFDVSCWLQSAEDAAVRDGDILIDHLPASPEELFAYDAIILMDPDPRELNPGWSELVSKLVSEHGAGVLYAAARTFTPSFMRDSAAAPIVQILPVTPDPEADLILNQIGHYQQTASLLEIPSAAYSHPVLRQGGIVATSGDHALAAADDPAAAKLAWSVMGRVYWHYPVLRAKPVATTLMTHGDPRMRNANGGHVLLATQYVGAGRTAFLGFDGTWRWRQYGAERFDRFWVQALRYLIEGKLMGGHNRGTLLTESDSYPVGEPVVVSARLYDARFEPETRDSVTATFRVDGSSGQFTLQRAPDRPGWFDGRFVPDRAGLYDITLTLPDAGSTGASDVAGITLTRQLQVVRSNLEMATPRMNREALVTLAEQSAGGRYFDPEQAAEIPKLIPDRHESTRTPGAPTLLWDRWWTLALLAGLLIVEWSVRKLSRLL